MISKSKNSIIAAGSKQIKKDKNDHHLKLKTKLNLQIHYTPPVKDTARVGMKWIQSGKMLDKNDECIENELKLYSQ